MSSARAPIVDEVERRLPGVGRAVSEHDGLGRARGRAWDRSGATSSCLAATTQGLPGPTILSHLGTVAVP